MSRQCSVPNWNLSPTGRQEPVEPEAGNRSSLVHSSLSPQLLSMSEYDISELSSENGHLTMHGLGRPLPWCQPSDTLESIVQQATQTQDQNLRAQVCATSTPPDRKCAPPVAGKRLRSDSDQGGRNNIYSSSSVQDLSTSATVCTDNDTTLMTWASLESPRSFKTKTTEDDLSWFGRSEKQEGELDTNIEIGRSNSMRRSRVAAYHNQSERKRRDKINQKMKALQKLVPNAYKTDKASMLDEVIQYLKQLQAQVHLMSMRNVPQMITPIGLQHQLQMSIMARTAMGLGNMARTPWFVPPPYSMQPMVQPRTNPNPAANASVPLLDPFFAYLAQTMDMDLYDKTAVIYRQHAKQNTLAGSSPSQPNNVQMN